MHYSFKCTLSKLTGSRDIATQENVILWPWPPSSLPSFIFFSPSFLVQTPPPLFYFIFVFYCCLFCFILAFIITWTVLGLTLNSQCYICLPSCFLLIIVSLLWSGHFAKPLHMKEDKPLLSFCAWHVLSYHGVIQLHPVSCKWCNFTLIYG